MFCCVKGLSYTWDYQDYAYWKIIYFSLCLSHKLMALFIFLPSVFIGLHFTQFAKNFPFSVQRKPEHLSLGLRPGVIQSAAKSGTSCWGCPYAGFNTSSSELLIWLNISLISKLWNRYRIVFWKINYFIKRWDGSKTLEKKKKEDFWN